MESLRIGGAEKSLLTLLSLLDYDRYEVELFLFRHNGELTSYLPSEVKLLPEDETYRIFDSNWKTAPFRYLKRLDWKRFFHSSLYVFGCLVHKLFGKLYIGWKHVGRLFSSQAFSADIAVAYLERKSIYFVAEKVSADKKIGFIHNDYSVYPYDKKSDARYFGNYFAIATVSDHCKTVLQERFPQFQDKFVVVKNMVSESMIAEMAQEPAPIEKKGIVIVTVGRLVAQKGYERAIEVCKKLLGDGLRFTWYAVGDGPERARLETLVERNGLRDAFIFVGATTNPYVWMGLADVYVQTSHFEGFGITVAEAKALRKKIVCSDIPEFREQLGERPATYATTTEEFAANIKAQLNSSCETADGETDREPLKTFCKLLEEKIL